MSAKIYTFTLIIKVGKNVSTLEIKTTTYRRALDTAILLHRVNEKSISQIKRK